MLYNEKTVRSLEFDKIRQMLADCALTAGARSRALALAPSDDAVVVMRNLSRTTDAVRLTEAKGTPSFGSVTDIGDAARRAEKGASLTPRELLDCANVLRTTRSLLDYASANRTFDTSLDEIFERLLPSRTLEDRIYRSIISEDMIADEASAALADIRRKINAENNRIREILQRYVGGAYSKYLQDSIITMRGGRYVVPVKVECKGEVKGLIHDTSSSGATVFIEPMPVVEANNELRALRSKEAHEIDRILSELSAEIAVRADTLIYNYENICELSFIFACAELSSRMRACQPRISEKQKVISFINARHPLIDKSKVVPISVSIGGEYDTIIITGPNTGGKTVTLKTLGLFSMMVQSGLHIPVEPESEISIFDRILVDIGDDQSIEQSLSTFSSHMVNIVDIVSKLTDSSLVLFDELGVGTDPIEGAALATSIIEHVREAGALCAATTHYAELKAYALDTDGVRNASCEFDVETLRPTYRLIIGTPGKSNAFAIAEKLGIPSQIVARAVEHTSAESRRFEDIIGELERSRIEMERQRDELIAQRDNFERERRQAEAEMKRRLQQAEEELERARKQAIGMVESARASSRYVFEQLEKAKKAQEQRDFGAKLDEARRAVRAHLKSHADDVDPVVESKVADEDYVLPRPLKVGDEVFVAGIDQNGTVETLPDKNNNLYVNVGSVKLRVKLSTVRLIEGQSTYTDSSKVKRPASTYTVEVNHGVRDEIDLRGMTGDEAWAAVDRYLDAIRQTGFGTVHLIHGKGTGALRQALWKYLKSDKRIKSFRIGRYGEGDGGVTVVEMKK